MHFILLLLVKNALCYDFIEMAIVHCVQTLIRFYFQSNKQFAKVIDTNVSSVVEFQRWWVLKCNSFFQESTCSKEIFLKQSCNKLWFVKKCRNCSFKVNFLCQKLTEFLQKNLFKNINLGHHFL